LSYRSEVKNRAVSQQDTSEANRLDQEPVSKKGAGEGPRPPSGPCPVQVPRLPLCRTSDNSIVRSMFSVGC